MKKILVTGSSSGLGRSIVNRFSDHYEVYGISRSDTPNILSVKVNFLDGEKLYQELSNFIKKGDEYEYVFLNAGILGNLKLSNEVDSKQLENSFNVNVMANKIIIDYFLNNDIKVKTFIGLSSGASSKGYYGWGEYCITKGAFKQMMSVYGIENPNINFISMSPGLVKTKMQDKIKNTSAETIPSLSKFHNMYDTMKTPDEVSEFIFNNLDYIVDNVDQHGFIDIRDKI